MQKGVLRYVTPFGSCTYWSIYRFRKYKLWSGTL